MYRRILVALENSPADESLLLHVAKLALQLGSELVLIHVADGFAARLQDRFQLADSEEIEQDRRYLEKMEERLRGQGLTTRSFLARGEPPTEILRLTAEQSCDLIAMGSHGHKWLGDLFLGSTISKVRHNTHVPVLIIRAPQA